MSIWRDERGWWLRFTRSGIEMTRGPFYARAFAVNEARYQGVMTHDEQ